MYFNFKQLKEGKICFVQLGIYIFCAFFLLQEAAIEIMIFYYYFQQFFLKYSNHINFQYKNLLYIKLFFNKQFLKVAYK